MRDLTWYVTAAIAVYMVLIIMSSFLRRVNPRKGTVAHGIHRGLFWITEPLLRPVRHFAVRIERGTVDWSMVIAVTILFLLLQAIRIFL